MAVAFLRLRVSREKWSTTIINPTSMHFYSIYSSWQITKTVKSFGFWKMKYILLLTNVALQTLFGWKSSPLNKNPIRSHIILTITPLIVPFTPIKWVSETQNHREKNTLLCLASSFAHTKTQFCFTYTTMLTGMHTFGYIGLAIWRAHTHELSLFYSTALL